MPARYSIVCDDDLARRIERVARENDITQEEAIRQLVETGLDSVERIA